ncbi:MAG: hypothetical protein WCP86_03870 [bacterium]
MYNVCIGGINSSSFFDRQRVQDEALRMGLVEARVVYVVMDGGIWLWNIFDDRFKQWAIGTLDFYHAMRPWIGSFHEPFVPESVA